MTALYRNTLLISLMVGGTLAAVPGHAQTLVTLNAGAMNGHGPFFLDFQLLDGSGTGDGNSRAIISGLSLTGGALGAPTAPTGAVSGSPTAGGLTLIDSDPGGVADYQRAFTVTSASSLLTFSVALTTTAPLDGPIPDTFNFLILESDGVTALPTLGPTGVEIASSNFTSLTPTMTGYRTDPSSPVTLGAPTIGNVGPPPVIPEPCPAALLALGIPGLALLARRRRHPA